MGMSSKSTSFNSIVNNLPKAILNRKLKSGDVDKWFSGQTQFTPFKVKKDSQEWSKRQKRAYMRVVSGLQKFQTLKKRISFLTLTSSNESDKTQLNKNFEVLRKRIERSAVHFHKSDYYPKGFKDYSYEGFKMDYIKIRTLEGGKVKSDSKGVLHILAKMPYISQFCLKANWESLHGAYEVTVKRCYNWSNKLGMYMISHYMTNQAHFEHISSSSTWLYSGFLQDFKKIIKEYGYRMGLSIWKGMLRTLDFWEKKKYLCLDLDGLLYYKEK